MQLWHCLRIKAVLLCESLLTSATVNVIYAIWQPFALQRLIDICINYYCNHSLRINTTKSKVMVVLPATLKDLYVPDFIANGSVLSFVQEEKYLGVILRNSCDDSSAITKEVRSLYCRGNMICRKFSSCCDEVKRQLFISFCSSFYCCSLWSCFSVSCLRSLHVAHNNIFRSLFHLPRLISISSCFVQNNIHCFKTIRRKLILSLYNRVLASDNQLIMALINERYVVKSFILKTWLRVLF